MAKNEQTSRPIGSLASKALRDPKSVTPAQIKKIAASALTQRPNKK